MYTGRTAARPRGCMKGPPAAEPHNRLARPSARLGRPHVGNAMSVGMSSGGADPQHHPEAGRPRSPAWSDGGPHSPNFSERP